MAFFSITLPEKPAAVKFTDKQSMEAIVATYQLQDNNTCSGSLYKLHGDKIVKQTPLPGGIFRFAQQATTGHIIAALTNGSLGIADSNLNIVRIIPVAENATLLSVSLGEDSALCSDSCGTLHVVNLQTGNVSSFLGHISPFTKEPCEIWTTTWLDANCVLSGAEDALLKLWDLRCNEEQPIGINRMHQCGVIALHEEDTEHIVSGSYDDCLRRIDVRNFSQSVLEKKMNGGTWCVRIADKDSYIVSCMYGGWALVAKKNFEILHANQKIGEDLLYDADFSPQASMVVSCTFNNYSMNFETL